MLQVARAPVALLQRRRRQAVGWAKVQGPARGGLPHAAEVARSRSQPPAARQSAAEGAQPYTRSWRLHRPAPAGSMRQLNCRQTLT